MFSTLSDYCNWSLFEEVKKLLESTPGIDITGKECKCIRLAIARDSPEILRFLLEYFSRSTPTDIQRSKIGKAFDEYINFEDLSPEMMKIVCKYLPFVAQAALVERAANDDTETVRILYKYFPEAKNDILEAVVLHSAYNVMEVLADMQSTLRQKAMVYCDIGDRLKENGIYAKACEFYEKAILADPTYIIPYIHYANNIVEQLCSSDSFNMDLALKSEEYYKKAIEFNPKYSSAYKKLGILYQEIAENQSDDSLKEHYAIKAFRSYIDAVKNKSEKLKYDSVYQEIKHIVMLYHSNDEVQKIIGEEVDDTKLQKLFTQITLGSISEDGSDVSDTLEILREMAEEDLEYEETDMDADLMGVGTVEVDI